VGQHTSNQDPVTTPETASPYDKELKEAGQLASPTWELELFLSGALVFATFQLPNVVDHFFAGFEPHLAGLTRSAFLNIALYAKAIAYTLLITFAVHLTGRAQWVALMGLQSVFPRGVRWDEMKMGPIGRKLYEERVPTLARSIATLDNFCSIIFSVGMLFAVLFIFSATLVGAVGSVAWLLAHFLSHDQKLEWYFLALIVAFMAIPISASLLDKRLGPRLSPESRGYRIVHRLLRISIAMSIVRIAGPMMWTLMSNLGRKKVVAALYVGLMGIIFVSAVDLMIRRGALGLNNYDFYGQSLLHGVTTAHYENQRTENANSRAPMIQSDIVRDPYVRLFIPYSPARHNAGLLRACPGLKPLQPEGVQFGADQPAPDSLAVPALQCMAKVHDVKLDGRALADLEFAFYEHPATGLRGVVAYIAIDSLAHGRHVLTVMPVPPTPIPTDSATLAKAAWKQPYVIPFWK
jgi:hypothetical protein